MVWGRCRKLRSHHEWCVMTRSTDPNCIITFTDLNLGKIRFFHKFDQFLDLSDIHDVLLLPLGDSACDGVLSSWRTLSATDVIDRRSQGVFVAS